MHKIKITTLRDEAKRQLEYLRLLLHRAQQNGLVDAPAQDPRNRATFDTESLFKTFEILDGENYKLDHLDMVLAVVGTMKAGKSTSINAIVGAEVLPNRNGPMTTLPTLIRHSPGVLQPRLMLEKVQPLNDLLVVLNDTTKAVNHEVLAELNKDLDMERLLAQVRDRKPFLSQHEGEQDIFIFLKRLNDLARLCFRLEVAFPFSEYSTVDTMPVIEVEFSHLRGASDAQGRLTLLDTPGPNEAGQQHLRHMLKDQLKKASAVLAVFDYTQLNSDADAQVREDLIEIADIAKGRMYALVNKFDEKDRHGDDETTVKQKVSRTLMKGSLTDHSVFPVSAKQGFLASRARNELARNGLLDVDESWVMDFAREAFGPRWEKYIKDPKEVQEAADDLWQQSGFATPLEQVIVTAHQNAALEALRSAASKLDDISKNAGDFFKANAGVLKKGAAQLQQNIDHLQKNIENISKIEDEVQKKLKDELKKMRAEVSTSADDLRKRFVELLEMYFKEGKRIEIGNQAQNTKKNTKNKGGIQSFSLVLRSMLQKNLQVSTLDDSDERDFDPNSSIIKFDTRSEADDFRNKIEQSIFSAVDSAELGVKGCIQSGIDGFYGDLEKLRVDALEAIRVSVQTNVEDFDIEIRLPDVQGVMLDASVSSILEDAVEERTKTVTRRRRSSGAWGKFCEWFNTDELGWEDYRATEEYYQVDLNKISKSSSINIEKLFASAEAALGDDIYPRLQEGVDEFFGMFREKVERIRGDLMSGVEKHRLDQASKAAILKDSKLMAREASDLEKDCAALRDKAEVLRFEKGISSAAVV